MHHRHIGKLANTDQRIVIAFMQLPADPSQALVIPVNALPPRLEQNVMEVLESNEGQADECLANVLHRRLMPDTGKTVLQTLHEGNHLVPVPTSNVVMLPKPNMPFPLNQILASMGRSVSIEGAPVASAQPLPPVEAFNPHLHNRAVLGTEEGRAIARNLLVEADLLAAEAAKKRDAAYTYAPELNPANAAVDVADDQPVSVTKPIIKPVVKKVSRATKAIAAKATAAKDA